MAIFLDDGAMSPGVTPRSMIKDAEMLARVAVRRRSAQGLSGEEIRRRVVAEFEEALVREGCEEMVLETLVAVVQRVIHEELDASRYAGPPREDSFPDRVQSHA